MPYTSATNTKILTFLNLAQTKIGQVSILVADKVSEEAPCDTYVNEAEIAYGLLSFTRSLDNNFNDWTEAEIIKYIDLWTARANLNDVPFYDHANFNERVTFTPLVVEDCSECINTRSRLTTSTATLIPNVSLYDLDVITEQAAGLTIANPIGTPVNGNGFMIDVTDDGNAQLITFGNKYIGYGEDLPTTTTAGKGMKLIIQYSSVTDTYDLLNVINEL